MDDFVKQDQSRIYTPLLEGMLTCPRHLNVANSHSVPIELPSSVHLDFVSIIFSVGVPDWSGILQLGTDYGLISTFSKLGVLGFKFLHRKSRDFLALPVILAIWSFQEMSTLRYLAQGTTSSVWLCSI